MSDASNATNPDLISEGEELTYEEIYSNAILNGSIIITIPFDAEETVKIGIKNYKSKQNAKLKETGQAPDTAILTFSSYPSTEFPDCIDLVITVTRRGTVKIKQMKTLNLDLD